ncbi:MAG TPA: choice-of-anchor L domain-containing protein [Polyangium sp.]|nr:choice-of-anchor L domain-containing protein [Polyangium sp.]
MRFSFRWGLVLAALATPAVWLGPGCGARTDIEDDDTLDEEEVDAGPDVHDDDAQPDVSPDVSPDVVVDVVEESVEDAPLDVVEDVPVDVTEDVPVDVPIDVPQDVPQDVPEDVPVDVPEDVPEDVPQDVPVDVPQDVPEDVPQDVPQDVSPDGSCPDADGDGYSVCDGDCNDTDPQVNPGAFDFPNGKDDDCEGGIDNPNTACSAGLQYTSQDPLDYAKSIELCQTTTLNATGANKRWGVITAELRLADGTGTPFPQSHAIITSMGNVIGPRANQNFVFLSTGLAATPSQPYFQFGTPQGGTDTGTQSATPPGFPTNKSGCPVPFASTAFNPVNLKIQVRTPTNANSFAFDHAYWSSEYPEYACSPFNDLWVVLLKTNAPGIANNRNVVFDGQGTPGSVNLNFFDRCVAGPTGCFGTPGFNFCSGGKSELAGTGYDDFDSPCNNTPSSIGGTTGWLTTEAPIMPGEIATVEFIVWDSSDGIFDSSTILDFFRWLPSKLANPKTYRP